MGRGVVDIGNMDRADIAALRESAPPAGLLFRVGKLGHVVLKARDLERSVAFYTRVLGFQVSDVYPETMVPGRMVFLRCDPDHHCLALVGGAAGPNSFAELHHLAFEVASLDELYRARKHLRGHGVKIAFEGRRCAGCQAASPPVTASRIQPGSLMMRYSLPFAASIAEMGVGAKRGMAERAGNPHVGGERGGISIVPSGLIPRMMRHLPDPTIGGIVQRFCNF